MDKIYIRDLRVETIIGVYPQERERKQEIFLNLVLGCDCHAAGVSDALEDAVNYHEIQMNVSEFVGTSRFQLLEALAEHVANICLATDGVMWVRVRIDKPHALEETRSVAIEIERRKEESEIK